MEERGGGVGGGISKHGARIEGMVKRIKGGGSRKKEGWWQGGKRHFPTAACFGGRKREEEEVEVVERGASVLRGGGGGLLSRFRKYSERRRRKGVLKEGKEEKGSKPNTGGREGRPPGLLAASGRGRLRLLRHGLS